MKKSPIAIWICLFAAAGVAADDLPQVAIPAGSPFSLSVPTQSSDDPRDSVVHFSGTATVRVEYLFYYDGEPGYDADLYLAVRPDERSIALLPYLTERMDPELPGEILIENPAEAAFPLLGQSLPYRVGPGGGYPAYRGEARVVIDDFGASYECDSPVFTARFVRIEKIVAVATELHDWRHTGC